MARKRHGIPIEHRRSAYRRELLWASVLFSGIFLVVLGMGSRIIIKELSNKEVFKMLHGYTMKLEQSLEKVPKTETLTGIKQQKIITTRLNEFLSDQKIFDSVELYDENGNLVQHFDTLKAGYLVPGKDPKGLQPGQQEIETANRIPISVKVPIEAGKFGTAILSVSEEVLARQATEFRNDMLVKIVGLVAIISLLLLLAFLYVLRLLRLTRRIEAEAQDQERLSYLGLLSSGIAHEVKNPLNSIQMNLQLLEEEAATGASHEQIHDWIVPIQREIRRLERLVNDFLLFARPLNAETQEVRADVLLGSIAELVAEEARHKGVHLVVEAPGDLPVVSTDESLLRTAILNLVFNAVQAIECTGTVTLRAALEGKTAVFEIADDGPGIPEERREKAFDIFFTTKSGGTGLGLPIARRILEGLGGDLDLVDSEGPGATFRATLPLSQGH